MTVDQQELANKKFEQRALIFGIATFVGFIVLAPLLDGDKKKKTKRKLLR